MRGSIRQRVLSEWTGLPFRAQPPADPSDLQAIFQKAFRKLGWDDRFQQANLRDSWLELVGPTLASHCHPGGVRRGVLFIQVDHSAWLHQITLAHKSDILKAVQQRFPNLKVQGLSLRLG